MSEHNKPKVYVGDEKGTRYEIHMAAACPSKWTLVVCEDRPGLYSPLLKELIAENLISKAISVPFCQASIALLSNGTTAIHGTRLDIANLDQCILILDMDCAEGVCDLPGIDETTRAYAGAEFFNRLPKRIQEKTYLASRLTPFTPGSDYFTRYPALAQVVTHSHFSEKEASIAIPELSDEAKLMIIHFIKGKQVTDAGQTFEPFHVAIAGGKKKPAHEEAKVCVSSDGCRPFYPEANNAARYVFICLYYAGKQLDTAKLVAVIDPPPPIEDPAIDPSEMVSGENDGAIQKGRGDCQTPATPDATAIRKYISDLQSRLDAIVETFSQDGKPVGEDSPIGNNAFLKTWCRADEEVDALRKQIADGGLLPYVQFTQCKWTVSARSLTGTQPPAGGKTKFAASGSIRQAINRWLHQEIEPYHQALFEHLWANIQRSDTSKTIGYSGNLTWNLGTSNSHWTIPLNQIEAQ
jgi:hypothetical protein